MRRLRIIFVLGRAFHEYVLAFKLPVAHGALQNQPLSLFKIRWLPFQVHYPGALPQGIDSGKAQVIWIFYRVKFNRPRFVKLCYQVHELAFFFTGRSHRIVSGKIAHEADQDAYGRSNENEDDYVDFFQETYRLLVRLDAGLARRSFSEGGLEPQR